MRHRARMVGVVSLFLAAVFALGRVPEGALVCLALAVGCLYVLEGAE